MIDALQLQCRLASLQVYPHIFRRSVGAAFAQALDQHCQYLSAPTVERSLTAQKAYGNWFYQLGMQADSWSELLEKQVLYASNPLAIQVVQDTEPSQALTHAVQQDLETLNYIAHWGPELICPEAMILPSIDSGHWTDRFFAADIPWSESVPQLCDYYRAHGTGVIAQYSALRWSHGRLVGIETPDPIRLNELVGYDRQKSRLCRNTEALLAGFTALNVLLYGCRGTGKSALVKALVHEYGDRGLRLVELSKADLIHLPKVVQEVASAPQKFIFFVDDLSFEEDEERYKALKVVLEGNLTARPDNVVVYATSNRRHLIREFFDDRPRPSDADEIHSWDTVQEKLSLSDRFGLSLTFQPANQDTYLKMVVHLAHLFELRIDPADLEFRALQWATQQNGRSGRTARQFIQALQAELNRPKSEGTFV